MKFYKVRALIFVLIVKLFSKIFFVEMPPIVSVTALIKKDEKLLFLDLSYLNGLGLPGGIVHSNEDAEESLHREVYEETGLRIISHKYLWSVTSCSRSIATLSLVYTVETSGEIKSSEEGKLYWLEPNEVIERLAYENAKIAIKRYLDLK